MPSHDEYGKKVLSKATNGTAVQYGSSVEISYGFGKPARVDGTVGGTIAVEIESRVSKQVRGAVLDLICHPYEKKLLALLPVHMSNASTCADQCRHIYRRFCLEDSFRVVVLSGSGEHDHLEDDAAIVTQALRELGASFFEHQQ